MMRGVRCLVGFVVVGSLGALAACSSGSFFAEREPWRKEAEARCLASGAVHEGTGIVRVNSINGPGVCGIDFPLKVSMLGQSSALGFDDELRPPAAIPNASRQLPSRWPIVEPLERPPYAPDNTPPPASAVEVRPLPPPAGLPPSPGYGGAAQDSQPLSIDPPAGAAAPHDLYDFRRPYSVSPPARAPVRAAPLDSRSPAYDLSPQPYEQRHAIDNARPRFDSPPAVPVRPAARTPRRSLPLGPSRPPQIVGATAAVAIKPTATLACPIVSALDQWLAGTVQPAAMHWFGQPVVEIRQISSYSCRGMNGNPRARISEHAFGNALDIAAFTLADGRRITVKNGWHGKPEEQGFLRDVQAGACKRFTTVLAPGYNVYHYNHIHVDLMRRRGGRHACDPHAVSGEVVAARARARYARRGDAAVTGSVVSRGRNSPKRALSPTAFTEDKVAPVLPAAIPGEDGEDED
jgi:hypothetical protein